MIGNLELFNFQNILKIQERHAIVVKNMRTIYGRIKAH